MLFIGQNGDKKEKIEVNQNVEVPWLTKSNKKVTLLFFGYVGCADVCAPLLYDLQTLYRSEELKELKSEIEVVFINLIPQMQPQSVDEFAKSFDMEFKGIYLSQKVLTRIEREFRLFFSTSVFDTKAVNHTDHVYLISNGRDRKLNAIYTTHPLDKELLSKDIKTILEYKH